MITRSLLTSHFSLLTILVLTAINNDSMAQGSLYTDANFTKTINTALPVGTVGGSPSVDLSGSASYAIPIQVLPGTNGVTPQVAVVYNSKAGNGVMGQGWNLSGLSSISRAGQSLYFDGNITATEKSLNDRFVLDGSRLILKTGTYGANLSTYVHESENFDSITAIGTHGNGPSYFTVFSKDGKKYEYGNNSNSKRLDNTLGQVLVWYLNKVTWPDGNYIEYVYTTTGSYNVQIDEIRYTGNASASLAPYQTVKFLYTSRSDIAATYEASTLFYNNWFLDQIQIYGDGGTFKTYKFNYGWDNINSYLTEVIEKAGNGVQLNSTIFKYGNIPANVESSGVSFAGSQDIDVFSMDINGDGYSDYVEARKLISGGITYNDQISFRLTNPYGGFDASVTKVLPGNFSSLKKKSVPDIYTFLSNDISGDGIDDVICSKSSGSGSSRTIDFTRIYLGNSNSTNILKDSITIYPYTGYNIIGTNNFYLNAGDFNGDGVGDILSIAKNSGGSMGIHLYYGTISSSFGTVGLTGSASIPFSQWTLAQAIRILDFNGDGKQDIMVTKDGNTEIFEFSSTAVLKSIYYGTFPASSDLVYPGDFNGDGKTDLLCRVGSTWKTGFSTGSTFNQVNFTFTTTPTIDANYVGDKLLILDANGDGKSDIFHGSGTGPSTLRIYFSKGSQSSFYYQSGSMSTAINTMPSAVFDLNGDGKSDLIARSTYTNNWQTVSFRKNGQELLLQKVKNGHNVTTEWQYKTMSDPNMGYVRGGVITGKVNNIQLPMYMVQNFIQDNGIGSGTNTILYKYEEAKLHKEGKGFLGFKKFSSTELLTSLRTENEQKLNTTYFTLLPYKTRLVNSGTSYLYNETTISDTLLSLGGKRFLYRLTSSFENKAFEGQTILLNNTSFDTFGNVLSSTTNVNSVETTVTTTAFGKYNTSVPAHPTSIQVSNTRTGQSAYSTTTVLSYNSIGQLTSKVEFSGTAKPVTTTFGYNNLGNLTQARVSAPDITARNLFSKTFDTKGRWALTNVTPDGTSTASYHAFWGKPLSVTGVSGLTMNYQYDLFGRDSLASYPQGYSVTTKYIYSSTWGGIYKIEVNHPGKPNQTAYFDKLGRSIKTETEGWQNYTIYTGTTYNALGLKDTETGPHKLSIGESGKVSYFSYDNLRRLTQVREEYGTNKDTISYNYTYGSGNLTTAVTNPAGQVSSKVTDVTGKTISATDYGGTLTYSYYSHGNVYQVKNGSTVLNTSNYDIYARQTSLTDINSGAINYAYNSLGEITSQTNANGQTSSYAYDTLGRITTKTLVEGTSTYEYFPKNNGANSNLLKKINHFTSPNTEEYTYDAYARVSTKKYTIDASAHTTTYTYNTYDDVLSELFESGYKLNYTYDANGYLDKIKNTDNSVTIFTAGTMNGYNQYLTYSLGNTLSSTNTYYYGMPTRYYTNAKQDYNLVWNYKTGNLTSRNDALISKTESFTYDNLNRLTGASVSGGASHSLTYASNGNISTKTDAGSYVYNASKINQVQQINPSAGNISNTSQAISTFTSFLQPSTVVEGVYNLTYTYADDEQRIKSVMKVNTSTINTKYYFGEYEKDITGTTTRYLHYVSNGEQLIAIVERIGSSDTYHYTYTDHLGSINTITNSSGTVTYKLNFDAWGRRRNATNWTYTSITSPPSWLTRGFTGHEHMDYFALINMNGRLYDPILGRMLSLDNFVQAAGSTQGFNRYSYGLNNPLKYVDPDGEKLTAGHLILGGVLGAASFQPLLDHAKGENTVGESVRDYLINVANFLLMSPATSLNLPIGKHFSFLVSPKIVSSSEGVGVGFNAGINFSSSNYFFAHLNASVVFYGQRPGHGGAGFEGSLTGGIGIGLENKAHGNLATTKFWSNGSSQRTAYLSGGWDDWEVSYENDGAPFPSWTHLNDTYDRYRSAAASINLGGYADLKTLLYTGSAESSTGTVNRGIAPYNKDGYYIGGDVDKYRLGVLSFGSKYIGPARIGINSEFVRHAFQNVLAHTWLSPQPMFKILSNSINFYYMIESKNAFTLTHW